MRFDSIRIAIRAAAVATAMAMLPAAPAAAADPPYDAALLRLSEILGAMHYLRPLCGAPEAGIWRNEMQALIDAEAPSPERRARLVAAFNQGYSGFAALYRTCTPAATAAIDRYLAEGKLLTRDVTARFGR